MMCSVSPSGLVAGLTPVSDPLLTLWLCHSDARQVFDLPRSPL